MIPKIVKTPILPGKIIEEQKNFYIADTPGGRVRTTLSGLLKKDRVRICVGDQVEIELINSDVPEGLIRKVMERRSFLPRPPLANIDTLFFINSFKAPPLDLQILDRFLFTSAVYEIESIIVFNKSDLLDKAGREALEKICSYYEKAGYRILHTSAKNQSGIDEVKMFCSEKTSVFAGLSGVGKSSLLAFIFPDHTFRTREVSGSTGRGTHTTTHISLMTLESGGYIADTPGFAFVEIPQVPEELTASYFPELESRTGMCRFNNCIHADEPGCIIRELVMEGEIAQWRHKHYLNIRNEMKMLRKRYR